MLWLPRKLQRGYSAEMVAAKDENRQKRESIYSGFPFQIHLLTVIFHTFLQLRNPFQTVFP